MRTLIEANGGDITDIVNTALETKLNKKQKDLLSDLKTKQAVDEDVSRQSVICCSKKQLQIIRHRHLRNVPAK